MGLISNFSFPITYFPWTHVFFSLFQPLSLPSSEAGGVILAEENMEAMDGVRGQKLIYHPGRALSAPLLLFKQTSPSSYTSETTTQICHRDTRVEIHARSGAVNGATSNATTVPAASLMI